MKVRSDDSKNDCKEGSADGRNVDEDRNDLRLISSQPTIEMGRFRPKVPEVLSIADRRLDYSTLMSKRAWLIHDHLGLDLSIRWTSFQSGWKFRRQFDDELSNMMLVSGSDIWPTHISDPEGEAVRLKFRDPSLVKHHV